MKCCDITSGKLRNRIVIQGELEAVDAVGGLSTSWQDTINMYAYIKPLSGNERIFSGRIESNITHKIYIRYNAIVSPKQRIVYKGRVMNIRAVINIEERDKFLELHCIENQAT